MDPLSQGVVGSIFAKSAAQRHDIRAAGFVGFVSALLADLDVFIGSKSDPLLFLEYHRHFTHSLLFIPLGALAGVIVCWFFVRRRLSLKTAYLYSFLGYLTAAPLDACTSYGTHLLWPFSDERTAWHIISIIDPVFTGTLLLMAILSGWKRSVFVAKWGLVFALVYLGLGTLQRERAFNAAEELVASREHSAERLSVKPSIGNLLLWRIVYKSGDHYYVDAINIGLFQTPKLYPGGALPVINTDQEFSDIPRDSTLAKDIRRFEFFSDYYLSFHPDRPDILSDVRYGLLPNTTTPLWGIEVNKARPNEHVRYLTFRRTDSATWAAFFKMLGRE